MTGARASSPFPSSVSRWNCLEIRSDQLAVKHTKLTSACDLPDGDRDATTAKRPDGGVRSWGMGKRSPRGAISAAGYERMRFDQRENDGSARALAKIRPRPSSGCSRGLVEPQTRSHLRAGDTNEAIQMLDLLLEFFADGAHWTRGHYHDGDGWRCLIGALGYLRRKHHVSSAPRAG